MELHGPWTHNDDVKDKEVKYMADVFLSHIMRGVIKVVHVTEGDDKGDDVLTDLYYFECSDH